jgi:N-acetylneuraminate synthase
MRSPGLIEQMAATGLPILLSSGMSGWDELDNAVKIVRRSKAPFAVMQCTTAYPCPPEKVGLNVVTDIHDRYQCPAGLSDHSGTIFPSLAAVTLGAAVIEVHVAFSREMFGPDVPASLTISELKQLVEGVRFIERMKRSPIDKTKLSHEIAPAMQMFAKSIVAKTDLPAGTILDRGHLALKKPGFGLPEDRISSIVSRKIRRAVAANTPIKEEDLE